MTRFLLILISFSSTLWASPELDSLWDQGVKAYENESYLQAQQYFEQWEKVAASEGIHSAEAHENLALVHSKAGNLGPTVFHLLKKALYSDSPISVLGALSSVNHLQKEMGSPGALTEEQLFKLYFLFKPNVVHWFALALFGLILVFLLSFVRKDLFEWMGLTNVRTLTGVLGGVLLLVLGMGFLGRQTFGEFGVLSGYGSEVTVFEDPKGEKKLVELASGTVVSYQGNSEESLVEIVRPISAWVHQDTLLRLNVD